MEKTPIRTRDRLGDEYRVRAPRYELMVEVVLRILRALFRKHDLRIHSLRARVKGFASFYEKIDKKRVTGDPFKQIHDLVGVRIVCMFREDQQRIERLLRRHFVVLRAKDLGEPVSASRQVGYRSKHFVVQLRKNRLDLPEYEPLRDERCEIQLRTVLQDAWAEVEHYLAYKSKAAIPVSMRDGFRELSEQLEAADKAFQDLKSQKQELLHSLRKSRILLRQEINFDSVNAFVNHFFTGPFYRKFMERPDFEEVNTADINWLIEICNHYGVTTVTELHEIYRNATVTRLMDRFHLKMRRAAEEHYYVPAQFLATAVTVQRSEEDAMRIFHGNMQRRYPEYYRRRLRDISNLAELEERLRELLVTGESEEEQPAGAELAFPREEQSP